MINDIIESVTKFIGLSQYELAVVLMFIAVAALLLSFLFIGDKDDDSRVIICVGRALNVKSSKTAARDTRTINIITNAK
jgi:hypothetical protein